MDHREPITDSKQDIGYEGISVPVGSDLQRYLSAGSISNTTEVSAVTTLFTDLKSTGIWDKLEYLFLCSPTSLAAALVNAKTGVSATNSGASHASAGLTTSGTNHFYATEVNFATRTTNSLHMSIYCTFPNDSTGRYMCGYNGQNGTGGTYSLNFYKPVSAAVTANYTRSGASNGISATVSNASAIKGFYVFNLDSSSSASINFNNGTAVTDTYSTFDFTGIAPTGNRFPIGTAYTLATTNDTGPNTQIRTFTLGRSLTSQQKIDLYNIVLAYNTALGRN